MAVSIMRANPKEATFDKFLRRIGGVADIAGTGLNAYAGIKKMNAESQERDDLKNGIYNDRDQDPTKLVPALEGEAGAIRRKVRRGDEIKEEFFKNYEKAEKAEKAEKTKSPEEIAYIKSQTAKNYADIDESKRKGGVNLSELNVEGIGIANNADDAKKIKDAKIIRDTLQTKLDELISLREKKGAEFLDRAAVNRGKQLAEQIRLQYKDLVKLGALSGADLNMVNKIIPEDPLETGFVLEGLKAFKGDVENDFQSTLSSRLKSSGGLNTLLSQKKQAPKSDEDKQAIEWAMSNPNDPRAAQILKQNNANVAR